MGQDTVWSWAPVIDPIARLPLVDSHASVGLRGLYLLCLDHICADNESILNSLLTLGYQIWGFNCIQ